ncbi:uncharacterized protein M6B38_275495 [Iris pallida]|uniref:Symplekin n=1 Tax=Iris pallida TaxID=29817 RepID=A0AAX6I5Z3_IRIPA|nr:uncharacterized protein M6B38_275495 [Iris pallida]
MEIDERSTCPTADDGLDPFVEPLSPSDLPRADRANGDSDHASGALRLLKELNLKSMEGSSALMPNLLSFLKHNDPVVVRQSITTGTSLFCTVLTEMALQLFKYSKVEGWLEEVWSWMVQFKDAVCGIMSEPVSLGTKLVAAKFLEVCFLLFTAEVNDNDIPKPEGKDTNFSISWFQGHPVLNQTLLEYEASKILDILINVLQSAHALAGSIVITAINCLASIAKKRPAHYNSILSVLLGFHSNFDTSVGGHAASVRYSMRTAFVGFLGCNNPTITESRDKLLRTLRAMYPGEATELIIRQIEKMSRSNERNFREMRVNKDDSIYGQISVSGDLVRKRPVAEPGDMAASDEIPAKRTHFDTVIITSRPALSSNLQDDDDAIINSSLEASLMDSDDTPVGQMIKAIGALLAAGERGHDSIDILILNTQADLMADIVIETMKQLPKAPSDLCVRNGSLGPNSQTYPSSVSLQSGPSVSTTSAGTISTFSEHASTAVTSSGIITTVSDITSGSSLLSDVKRDPRRDPRRLDPRRAMVTVGPSPITLNSDSINGVQHGPFQSSCKSSASEAVMVENALGALMPKAEVQLSESSINSPSDHMNPKESLEIVEYTVEVESSLEDHLPSISTLSPVREGNDDLSTSKPPEVPDESTDGSMLEDQYSPPVSMPLSYGEICHELPEVPPYVDLKDEQKKALHKLAITRIIEDCKKIQATSCGQSRHPLLARLLAQTDVDEDIIVYFQKYIILDYHHHKGHDLAMHVLYQLHCVMLSDLEEHLSATEKYEKFLVAVAKTLLDSLPASDKSFSKLLGEAPSLPESALKLLEDLCHLRGYDRANDIYDGDRVTQGLGAVWSIVLARPFYRKTCLNIALKCSIHSHDEVRAKAIRLVANKLFLLNYASETIEQFARSMLLSVVDQHVSEAELKPFASSDQQKESGSQEASISGSNGSEPGASESEPIKGVQASFQSVPAVSLLHAQQYMSLFFALCTKKPSLLCLVFDIYGRASKAVKQAVQRHVPTLVRTLGSSSSELLNIISDPPEGSESLITQVLQVMTEESTPSADLISAVKQLYNTKLKDVTILIPMLSSLSKDEVLPIFPRLIDLPLEMFQVALARILQGSAHTGPALTPVEVLIAVHGVEPEKDGVSLKKAC